MTQSGALVGTPNYMAPEQALGKTTGLTTAADVHALGAILYELLTGRPPFLADNVLDTLLRVREAKPEPPRLRNPRVDTDLETICLKCLEKEPARRYGSAAELADDLERWQCGEPVRARRTPLLVRLAKWARRRPGLAVLTAFVAVFLTLTAVLGAAYVGTATQLSETETQRQVAEDQRQEAEQARHNAEEQRQAADHARHAAEEAWKVTLQAKRQVEAAHQEARLHLYLNRVMRAHFEWLSNDVGRADQLLDECPNDLRNWEWRYVKRLCQAELLTLKGHTAIVGSVAFSPDGKRLASASDGRTVKVWDVATGRELLSLRGHTDWVRGVAFSPDGRRLATALDDGTVKVWDATLLAEKPLAPPPAPRK